MKTWKLVSGILSIIIFVIVSFQSCAAGVVNSVEGNGGNSGSVGFICGALILSGGIVSIVSHKSVKKGGNIAIIILFGLCAIMGFTGYDNYKDLVVWSIWAAVNAVLAIIALMKNNKNNKKSNDISD